MIVRLRTLQRERQTRERVCFFLRVVNPLARLSIPAYKVANSNRTIERTPILNPQVEAHLSEIAEQGYTLIPDLFDPETVRALRDALDSVIQDEIGSRGRLEQNVQFVYNLTNKHSVCRTAVQHPKLIAIMENVLGPDCVLSSLNSRTSFPGSARQGMHRDVSFIHLSVATSLNSVWMLDDFTEANGSTCVVPGSHLWERGLEGMEGKAGYREIIATGKAGSVLIFDARVIHGGGANRTDAPRRAMHGYFCRSWIKPQYDHTRSISFKALSEATPLLVRLWGFKSQVPYEATPGQFRIMPAPGVDEQDAQV